MFLAKIASKGTSLKVSSTVLVIKQFVWFASYRKIQYVHSISGASNFLNKITGVWESGMGLCYPASRVDFQKSPSSICPTF